MKRTLSFLFLVLIGSFLFAETYGQGRNRYNRQTTSIDKLIDRYNQDKNIHNAAILAGAAFGQKILAQSLYDNFGDSNYIDAIDYYQSIEDKLNKDWFTPRFINIYEGDPKEKFYNKECRDLFWSNATMFSGAY